MADRDHRGRFTPGNKVARGNPHYRRAMILRRALLEAVDEDDLKEAVRVLVAKAKQGDVVAIRELLDRTIGKAAPLDLLARLDELEVQVAERLRLVRRA